MWRYRHSSTLIALVGLVLLGRETRGQACCGPPMLSLAGTERGIDPTTSLALTAAYSFLRFAHSVDGSKPIPDPLQRRALSHLWRVELEVVPHPRWALLLSLPIAAKERSLRFDTLATTYRAAGIGDAFVLLKRDLSPQEQLSEWSFALGAGLKLPTGASDREQEGVRLPRDVQPGSGTWELALWGFTGASIAAGSASWGLSLLVRWPVNADRFTYRNGAELQALLLTTWLACPATFCLPGLAFRLRTVTPDHLNGQQLPATGGLWLDALPTLTFPLPSLPLAFRLQGTVPLVRHTRGLQLVHSWGIAAEARWSP